MLYKFVAAIAQHKNQTHPWQEWLRLEFTNSHLSLTEDDKLLYADDLIGFFRFIELKEAEQLFNLTPWFVLTQECPWFEGLAGFFNWTHVADQTLAEEHLLPNLVEIGSTIIARTDNQQFKQPIRPVEFSLTDLLSKHGFNDGDALLSKDKNYLSYVYEQVTNSLKAADLSGHIAILETIHNPLQLSEDLHKYGQPVSDEWLTLAELSVQFWAYDWDILKDLEFWQD